MMKPLAKVVLLTRDEHDLIEDFVTYYAYLFGLENIVIIDNDSKDPHVLAAYESFRARGVVVKVESAPFCEATTFMSRHLRDLADEAVFLLPLETDEFIYVPSLAESESVGLEATRAAVHQALSSMPPDVSVVRYAKFMGSVVDPEDSAYTPGRGYTRPARQMTRFYDQGWDKLIVRADSFVSMRQWCHHANMARGREVTAPQLGLLHFHATGFRRQIERSLNVLETFRYVDLDATLGEQLQQAVQSIASCAACTHRVKYYLVYLQRLLVLHILPERPSRDELTRYSRAVEQLVRSADPELVRGAMSRRPSECHVVPFHDLLYGDYGDALAETEPGDTQEVTQVHDALGALSLSLDVTFGDVLARYASNHNNTGTDKTTSHAYGDLYSRIFAPFRTTAEHVLEIGVYSGASVLAMADFFERAQVTGLDITLSRIRFGTDHPRITYVEGDGTLPETAGRLGETWDVVLDDGSHLLNDQLAAFRAFGPHVRPGGIYVIEDIDGRQDGGLALRSALVDIAKSLRYQRLEWYDLRHVKGQFDDIVAVLHASAKAS